MSITPKRRLRVFERDGFKCQACGTQKNLTIDHILPRSQGGGDNQENLRTFCRSCNINRGNYNPSWWDRLTSWFFTRKEAHKMRYDLLAAIQAKDETLKKAIEAKAQSVTIDLRQETNKRIDDIKPSLADFINKSKIEVQQKLVGLENTTNSCQVRGKERDQYLRAYLELLADRVQALEEHLALTYDHDTQRYDKL